MIAATPREPGFEASVENRRVWNHIRSHHVPGKLASRTGGNTFAVSLLDRKHNGFPSVEGKIFGDLGTRLASHRHARRKIIRNYQYREHRTGCRRASRIKGLLDRRQSSEPVFRSAIYRHIVNVRRGGHNI